MVLFVRLNNLVIAGEIGQMDEISRIWRRSP